jgi:hypothetical protein
MQISSGIAKESSVLYVVANKNTCEARSLVTIKQGALAVDACICLNNVFTLLETIAEF